MRPEFEIRYAELNPNGSANVRLHLPQDVNHVMVKIFTEGKYVKGYIADVKLPAGDSNSMFIPFLTVGKANRIQLRVSVDGDTYSASREIEAAIEATDEDASKRPNAGVLELFERGYNNLKWRWSNFSSPQKESLQYETSGPLPKGFMPRWSTADGSTGYYLSGLEDNTEQTIYLRAVSKSGYHSNTLVCTANTLTDSCHIRYRDEKGRDITTRVFYNLNGKLLKVKQIWVNKDGKIEAVKNAERVNYKA